MSMPPPHSRPTDPPPPPPTLTVPVSDLRANFRHFMERVTTEGATVIITRYNRPAAVILPAATFERMSELVAAYEDLRD